MRNENKRQLLIDSAYRVFVRKGFINASIKDIASEADITPGLVHYYFKNKEELLLSVQKQIQEKYHKNYEEEKIKTLTPRETLMEIKSRAEKDEDWYRWRYEIYSLGLKSEQMKQEVADILKSGRESLSLPLKSLFKNADHTDEMAGILVACFDGLALQKMVDKEFDLDQAYELLIGLVEIYLKK